MKISLKTLFGSLLILLSLAIADTQAAFKLPAYEKHQLDNGLTVILMRQSEVPLVDVRLVTKAGSIDDENDYGLAQMTSDSLIFGAGSRSKSQLEELFDSVGAQYFSYADKESSVLGLSFASKDSKVLMPVFSDLVLLPAFDKDEFDRYKTRYLVELEQQRESPRNVIRAAFDRLYFGQHPYATPAMGTADSVKNIGLEKIKSFFKSSYTPDNSAILVVGDIETGKWLKLIKRQFGNWKGKKKAEKVLPLVQAPTKAKVLILDKPDAIETTFVIGGKGIPADHKDAVALSVVNTILGGRFTSWLNDELRVNSGLTYGARSGFSSYSKAGTFTISTFTKKETTFEAIDLALKTYGKIWEKGIDEATLKSAKAYVKGRFPPRYETSSQLVSLLARMWAQDLPDSYINDFEQSVNQLDVSKANALAKKYLPKDNLQFVLIGNAKLINQKAKEYGSVQQSTLKSYTF